VAKQRREKSRVLGWLAVFVALPLALWLTATLGTGVHGKSLSNLSLEPLCVALLSIAIFAAWFLLAPRGLRPVVGVILLIILLGAALAIQRFVPSLHE
jgi:hypothetical protein